MKKFLCMLMLLVPSLSYAEYWPCVKGQKGDLDLAIFFWPAPAPEVGPGFNRGMVFDRKRLDHDDGYHEFYWVKESEGGHYVMFIKDNIVVFEPGDVTYCDVGE